MIYWRKGNPINLIASVNPGENQIISEIKWMMNGTIIPASPCQEQIEIDTSGLSGECKLSILTKNLCGVWSDEYYKLFYIIEANMEKEITILVDKPLTNAKVVMDYTGTINVLVVDPIERPVEGATVQIVLLSITTTTDTEGKAVIQNIPYGTHVVKVTVP